MKTHEYLGENWLQMRIEYGLFFVIASSVLGVSGARYYGSLTKDDCATVGLLLVYVLMIINFTARLMWCVTNLMQEMS